MSTHLAKNQDVKNKTKQAIRVKIFNFFDIYTLMQGTWVIKNTKENGAFMGLNST